MALNNNMYIDYQFSGKLWKDNIPGGWHFVSISIALSNKIRKAHLSSEEGWGRLKVQAVVGKTEWRTSIWYDTKTGGYLLPINGMVRKKEAIVDGSKLKVKLNISLD